MLKGSKLFTSENGTKWSYIHWANPLYPGQTGQHTNGSPNIWFKKEADKNWKLLNQPRLRDALVKWVDLLEGYEDYEIEHFLDEVRYD